MGFNVDSVSSGYEALEHVEKKAYDVVLMDHQMDGLDGLETTVRIRKSANPQVADLKVIALTASALKGDQEKFLASGADGYLSKVRISSSLRQPHQLTHDSCSPYGPPSFDRQSSARCRRRIRPTWLPPFPPSTAPPRSSPHRALAR